MVLFRYSPSRSRHGRSVHFRRRKEMSRERAAAAPAVPGWKPKPEPTEKPHLVESRSRTANTRASMPPSGRKGKVGMRVNHRQARRRECPPGDIAAYRREIRPEKAGTKQRTAFPGRISRRYAAVSPGGHSRRAFADGSHAFLLCPWPDGGMLARVFRCA